MLIKVHMTLKTLQQWICTEAPLVYYTWTKVYNATLTLGAQHGGNEKPNTEACPTHTLHLQPIQLTAAFTLLIAEETLVSEMAHSNCIYLKYVIPGKREERWRQEIMIYHFRDLIDECWSFWYSTLYARQPVTNLFLQSKIQSRCVFRSYLKTPLHLKTI